MLASLFLLLPNLLRVQAQGVKAKMVEWRPVANRLATLGVRTSLRGLRYLKYKAPPEHNNMHQIIKLLFYGGFAY